MDARNATNVLVDPRIVRRAYDRGRSDDTDGPGTGPTRPAGHPPTPPGDPSGGGVDLAQDVEDGGGRGEVGDGPVDAVALGVGEEGARGVQRVP